MLAKRGVDWMSHHQMVMNILHHQLVMANTNETRQKKLKLIDGIFCATCGYNINFHPHAKCEYEEEEE
jgi:hypothetical protein